MPAAEAAGFPPLCGGNVRRTKGARREYAYDVAEGRRGRDQTKPKEPPRCAQTHVVSGFKPAPTNVIPIAGPHVIPIAGPPRHSECRPPCDSEAPHVVPSATRNLPSPSNPHPPPSTGRSRGGPGRGEPGRKEGGAPSPFAQRKGTRSEANAGVCPRPSRARQTTTPSRYAQTHVGAGFKPAPTNQPTTHSTHLHTAKPQPPITVHHSNPAHPGSKSRPNDHTLHPPQHHQTATTHHSPSFQSRPSRFKIPPKRPHTPPTFTPPNRHHPSQSIIPIPPIPVQKPTKQPTNPTPQPHQTTTTHHSPSFQSRPSRFKRPKLSTSTQYKQYNQHQISSNNIAQILSQPNKSPDDEIHYESNVNPQSSVYDSTVATSLKHRPA